MCDEFFVTDVSKKIYNLQIKISKFTTFQGFIPLQNDNSSYMITPVSWKKKLYAYISVGIGIENKLIKCEA